MIIENLTQPIDNTPNPFEHSFSFSTHFFFFID